MATFGILVGGGPAPGINGVISAAATAAVRRGARVIGIRDGFKWIMVGDTDHTVELDDEVIKQHPMNDEFFNLWEENWHLRGKDKAT